MPGRRAGRSARRDYCANLVRDWHGAERRSLLPSDFSRFDVSISTERPLITLPPDLLLARLAEEYVFAEHCDAALAAFAAENETRVAAMLAAKGNLETMRTELLTQEQQTRQEEITAEIVELTGGIGLTAPYGR